MLIIIDQLHASTGTFYGHAYALICKLTKLSLNNIEFFISYFYQLFCFYCYVRMVTLNLTLVLRKKEHNYFSLCQWNVNILVARKKYLY